MRTVSAGRKRVGGKAKGKLTYICPICKELFVRGFHSVDKTVKPASRVCGACAPKK